MWRSCGNPVRHMVEARPPRCNSTQSVVGFLFDMALVWRDAWQTTWPRAARPGSSAWWLVTPGAVSTDCCEAVTPAPAGRLDRLAGSGDTGLRAIVSLRLSEAAGQLTDVTSADQPAHRGMTRRRQCPIIAGCAAAPDPPPRVSAPESVKVGILIVPAPPGVHRGQWAAGRPNGCGRWAGAWMAAGAMLVPPRCGICGVREPTVPAPGVPAVWMTPRPACGHGPPLSCSGSSCRLGTAEPGYLTMRTARPAHRITADRALPAHRPHHRHLTPYPAAGSEG
jgi:hypothetical protein